MNIPPFLCGQRAVQTRIKKWSIVPYRIRHLTCKQKVFYRFMR